MSNYDYIYDGMIVLSTITWNAFQVKQMFKETKSISVDNIFQRSFNWDIDRKSLLIHSILIGFPVPVFWANDVTVVVGKTREGKDKTKTIYDLLDGKQRFMSIITYLDNEYALHNVPPIMYNDEVYELEGKTFKELPEDLQEKIKAFSLVIKHGEFTNSQIRELFRRLNNGKPLSTKEKNIANCGDIISISELAKHPFFNEVLTDKAKESRKSIPLIVKISEMLTKSIDEISFESKDFNETMETVELSDLTKANINRVLNKALAVYNLFDKDTEKGPRRKFVSETNFISLVPYIWKAEEANISDQLFADFIKANFTGKVSVSDRYASAARAASAKTSSIMARDEELSKAWAEFFKADEEETTEEEPVAESETAEEETVEETVVEEKHYYGMRLRGAAPSCQPDGFDEIKEDPTGKYYNILVYSRKLTEEEERDYELDHLYD